VSPQLLTCSYCERPSVVSLTVRTSEPVDPYAKPAPMAPSRVDVVRYCGVEHQPPERVTA
jgi:hypothetical protein